MRSRRQNQRNPQTQLLLLHMVVNLGAVDMVMVVLVDMETPIAVLAVAVLALPRIGHLGVLEVVGLVIMVDMVVEVILVVAMATLEVVIMLDTEERQPPLATPVALVLMEEGSVGDIVEVD